jgi:hypothetical protein
MRETNRITNGDMRIDQRNAGASIAVTSGSVFCVDRFRAGMSGANGTGQRVACSLPGFPFMLQLTGASGTTAAWIGQMIASVNTVSLVGKRVTVQFRVASSSVATLVVNLKAPTVADNYTATTTVESKTVAITPTLTYYEVTFDNVMPSAAARGLYLEFVTSTNLGTGTLQMTGVQLEAGTEATPFAFRPYEQELALCQRHYFKTAALPLGVTLNVSDGYSAVVRFPVTMHANPTLDSGASYSVGSGSAGTPSISATNTDAARMSNSAANWSSNVAVSLTAGFSAEIA